MGIKIADYIEYQRPNKVIITLTDGRSIEVAEKRVPGGKATYLKFVTALDNIDNPICENWLNNVITRMLA